MQWIQNTTIPVSMAGMIGASHRPSAQHRAPPTSPDRSRLSLLPSLNAFQLFPVDMGRHMSTEECPPPMLSQQQLQHQLFLQQLHLHQQHQQRLQQQQQQQQSLLQVQAVDDPYQNQSLESGSPDSIPDVNYVADMIARRLLPFGADLFNDKKHANCILLVEDQRYFVHVQMLAARSPTFRHIFDDMIQKDAWDTGHDSNVRGDEDTTSTSASHSMDHEDDEDSDFSVDQEPDEGSRPWQEVFTLDEDLYKGDMFRDTATATGEATMSATGANWNESRMLDTNFQNYGLQEGAPRDNTSDHQDYMMATSQGSEQNESSLDDDDDEEEEEKEEGDDGDEDHGLPVLTLQMADPEGSCFYELLYWLYTDDGPRWIKCFTPQNYDNILENIRTLNLFTQTVLGICQEFEQTTNPELGLRGKAEKAFN